MLRLSLMTMSMFIPVIIKIKMEQDMEDALELYGEMLDLAADAGFEAVDVTSMELDMIGKETVKEYLEARGLKVSSLIYFNQFASTDEEKCREIVEGGKHAVDLALYLGTEVLMLVPQAHEGIEKLSAEEIHRALIGNFTPVTAYAVERGVHSVIEDTPDLKLHLCRAEDRSSAQRLKALFAPGNLPAGRGEHLPVHLHIVAEVLLFAVQPVDNRPEQMICRLIFHRNAVVVQAV